MKSKIRKILLVFIIIIIAMIKVSNAQTMGELTRLAINDLKAFFQYNVKGKTDGNTDTGGTTYANYCMDPSDHGDANHSNMATAVVDVGAKGMSSVNNISTTNSEGARRAMQVLYYATKSYINREGWGGTSSSPYRLMMMQTAAMYSTTIKNAGLFNSSLPGGVNESYMINQFGRDKYLKLKQEGENYVNSTKDYTFENISEKGKQTIQEVGDWIFVGPYKIKNTGNGSVTKAVATTETNDTYNADGWSSSLNTNGVQKISTVPNGNEFYLVFKTKKVDSVKKVEMYKQTENVLRARMVFYASDGGQNMATYGGLFTSSTNKIELPGVPFSYIKIKKTDKDTGKALENIGFIVYNETEKKWVQDGTPAKFVDNKKDATIYKSDSNGTVNVRNLNKKGVYKIYEVINPYFGYEEASVENPSSVVEANIKAVGQTITVNMENEREYIKIRGYAWEERVKEGEKNSTKDNVWTDNSEDKRLENVTVRLIDSTGIIIAQTVTNENGEYVFGNYDENPNAVKIEIDKLVNAYIEFEYNGMSYKSIEVNTKFVESTDKNSAGNAITKYSGNSNTATDEALREEFNNEYATISKGISSNVNDEKTYDISYDYNSGEYNSTVSYGDKDNLKYGYEEQNYPISGTYEQYTLQAVTEQSSTYALCTELTSDKIREESVEEIGGLNLGLEEREMPDVFLLEDMEKVEISLNDYTHTYQYAQRFENPEDYVGGEDLSKVSVRFANKYLENSYSREVYSSDIVYNKQPGNEGKLKVFVTYKVKITNEATNLYSNVKTLANYYDERYENVVVRDENGNIIESQLDNSYNENGLKRVNINLNYQIEHGKTRELTITYQLNNDAINSILNEQLTLESVTEVTSYSSYSDEKYSTPYAGIDIDSAPDTVKPKIIEEINSEGKKVKKVDIVDTLEDDTDKAPSLILNVKEGRIIKGTVWEDSAIESLLGLTGYDKERKGDGIYEEDTENIVKNVKVELMKVTDSDKLELAKLYKKDETVVDASTTTEEQGEYSLVGVIPGKYVLRYTYGDNSVIVDTNGNTIEKVNIDNYKSTIYRGGNKDAVEAMKDYWYGGETSGIENVLRLSDAKDNDEFVQDRIKEEEIDYSKTVKDKELTEISADTRMFDIKLDYDINSENVSEYGAELKFVFDNIDFGIIERPRQSLIVDKQVANVKIALANGNTIINGDPRVQTISGVRLLDDDVFIEIDKEIIQGATLTITYEISVDNSNCEIDYNNEDYYIYGTVPNGYAGWKIATVVDMFDYLPEDLELQSTDQNSWERIEITQDMKNKLLAEKVYDKVKGLNNVIHLASGSLSKFEKMEPGSEAIDTSMVASKILATSTDDLTYENDVEIIKIKGRKTYNSIPGNYDPTTNTSYNPDTDQLEDIDELDDDNVEVTITPPTGENSSYIIYIGIGLSMLVAIGIGIIIIKRKVI